MIKRWSATRIRGRLVESFLQDARVKQDLILPALVRCGAAPFLVPSSGLVGYIWKDVFSPWHVHQGIDIFSGTEVGLSPVYAASDGYLSRLAHWKSAVIIRIPVDPLQPDRQIWTYYAHMADAKGTSLISADFPPGVNDIQVSAGTLLGYQGNYSGMEDAPVGVHLHFSVIKDNGMGRFLNELKVRNTLDPSPYFGLPLNAKHHRGVVCCDPET